MKIGLVGLPGSGKTSCFRILSGHHGADTHHGAQVATVPLPDERVDRLQAVCKSANGTYPDVTFMDFEALRQIDIALELVEAKGSRVHRGKIMFPCR